MKKQLILFLIIFSILSISYSQKTNLDSLWKIWKNVEKNDSIRLIALQKFSWDGYIFTQPDTAFKFFQVEYNYAKSKDLKQYMATALNSQGVSFAIQGDYINAIEYYTKCLKVNEEIGSRQGISVALGNIGSSYTDLGDYIKAIDFLTKSLKIKEELGNKKGVSKSLNNIGIIYMDIGCYKSAMDYLSRSLKIKKEINENKTISSTLTNIGEIYLTQKNYDKALDYLNQSLSIDIETGDKYGISACYGTIGHIYSKKGDITKAMDFLNKSLEIKKEIGDKKGLSSSLSNIGEIYLEQNDYKNAIKYANESLNIALEIKNSKEIKSATQTLYKAHKLNGNSKLALEMFELYNAQKDSIINEENKKEIFRQEYKYNYEKQKALDDKDHEKEMAIAEEQKKKQKVISYSIAGGLALSIVFFIFVFNRLQITRKQKALIQSQKNEVEFQKTLVDKKNTEITDSINYAKRIQTAILPSDEAIKEFLDDSFIFYKPKDIVAGDFYWLQKIGNKTLFAAADCTGHGVPGAMVSVVCNNALNRSVREYNLTEPNAILNKTREIVINEFEKSKEDVKDGMDIALCLLENNVLKYAGANNPLWIIRNNEIIEIKADKQPIGKFINQTPFKINTIELKQNDTIYIFSDGYIDQFGGEKGKKFKTKSFRSLILSIQDKSMNEQKIEIENNFNLWKGNFEQIDDICVIGVKIK